MLLLIIIFPLIISCSDSYTLTMDSPPEFELKIARAGDNPDQSELQSKDGLIIETTFWNEEPEVFTQDDLLNLVFSLSSVEAEPYEVKINKYWLQFDFANAADQPNKGFGIANYEDGSRSWWELEIDSKGVVEYSAPDHEPGLNRAVIIFQWIDENSMVLGQQFVRFNLNVIE